MLNYKTYKQIRMHNFHKFIKFRKTKWSAVTEYLVMFS